MAEVRKAESTAESRKTQDKTGKYLVYWLTREVKGGVLSDKVEIWLVKPERLRFGDGDVMWLAPADTIDRGATFYGEWTVEEAKRQVGNGVPDDSIQCLKVGNDSENPTS